MRFGKIPIVGRALVAMAMLAGVVLQLEIGLRLQAYLKELRVERGLEGVREGAWRAPGARVGLENVIQLSNDPKIVYELIPDLSVPFQAGLKTSHAGFRSPEVSIDKPPRTVRLVGLGDSVMFGYRVHDDEPFMGVLAKRLREGHPEVAWESINMAVPGYNSVMELETLITKGLRYRPDLVILNVVANDGDLPNFIRVPSRPFALGHSFLKARVHALLYHQRPSREPPAGMAPAPKRGAAFLDDPERVPAEYREMVGPDATENAIREARDLAQTHGFALILIGHPRLPPNVAALAHALQIPAVESEPTIARYTRAHGIPSLDDRRLRFSEKDPHPTALGHRLIAEAILTGFERLGLAQSVSQRALAASGAAQVP